jgi:hypothetical protein
MDIIQRLPFPDEVCRKIFLFACKNTDRNCIGIEINPEYYEISRTRYEL